ncbi:galactose-1-phosphate uridylyltransferase [Salininema proteolyticum]|uniref:Galactose-1-phosphate uridylyltransferase n=1 Tax=Salininema proteolyticum TaxID=1607685 RepID=A0ABV8TYI9_9ACTN
MDCLSEEAVALADGRRLRYFRSDRDDGGEDGGPSPETAVHRGEKGEGGGTAAHSETSSSSPRSTDRSETGECRGPAAHPDRRETGPPPRQGERRWDVLRREWVVVSASRNGRPLLPVDCPLCPTPVAPPEPRTGECGSRAPSPASGLTEIPAPGYDIAVFDNRFPSLTGTGSPDGKPSEHFAEMGLSRPANGHCEVVCFSDDHDATLSSLSTERIADIVAVQARRSEELLGRDDVREVACFENHGVDIGVTLHHPHGQIYAYPYTTPDTERVLESAAAYLEHRGRNLFEDLIAAETVGPRVVARSEDWIAFVPYSARWPCELRICPLDPVSDLPGLSGRQRRSFAEMYRRLLRALESVLGADVPYMAAWRQAPRDGDPRTAEAWRLSHQLVSPRRAPGKIKYLASSESLMGAFVNDVVPEEIAARLAEAYAAA